MSELKYDPELPFALVSMDGKVRARFAEYGSASRYEREIVMGKVVDTTPKPKIPEDAQHITWGEQKVAYSRWEGGWIGWDHGRPLTEEELLQWVGKDDVIVLVPKEEP